jgi:hypothetical protein
MSGVETGPSMFTAEGIAAYSAPEAAVMLGWHEQKVRRHVEAGKLAGEVRQRGKKRQILVYAAAVHALTGQTHRDGDTAVAVATPPGTAADSPHVTAGRDVNDRDDDLIHVLELAHVRAELAVLRGELAMMTAQRDVWETRAGHAEQAAGELRTEAGRLRSALMAQVAGHTATIAALYTDQSG